MDGYIELINANYIRIKNSDIHNLLNISLKNYEDYVNFFVSMQNKHVSEGKEIDVKINVLNALNMHSTFLLDSFLKNVMINNYSSTKIISRSIIEFYIKYKFILYCDEYVSEIYRDFSIVTLSKHNNDLKLSDKARKKLDTSFEEINIKYNLKGKTNDDVWIKYALDYQKKANNSEKNLGAIVKYLLETSKLPEWSYKFYSNSCDFNHIGYNSLDEQQYIDLKLENGKFKSVYLELLFVFNYVIWDIYKSYIIFFNISNTEEKLSAFSKRMKMIEAEVND